MVKHDEAVELGDYTGAADPADPIWEPEDTVANDLRVDQDTAAQGEPVGHQADGQGDAAGGNGKQNTSQGQDQDEEQQTTRTTWSVVPEPPPPKKRRKRPKGGAGGKEPGPLTLVKSKQDTSTTPKNPKQLAKGKPAVSTVVQEESISVLKELGTAVNVCTQRMVAQETQKSRFDDDISVWAGQCERKVRRIADPLLQEDLMDHITYIIKQTTRGLYSVNTLKPPNSDQKKPVCKSPLTSFVSSFPTTSMSMSAPTTTTSVDVPTSVAQQSQSATHSQLNLLDQQQQLNVIAHWQLTGSSSSPGPVMESGVLQYPTQAEYASLTTIPTVFEHMGSSNNQ